MAGSQEWWAPVLERCNPRVFLTIFAENTIIYETLVEATPASGRCNGGRGAGWGRVGQPCRRAVGYGGDREDGGNSLQKRYDSQSEGINRRRFSSGTMGVISADLGYDCADCHPGAGSDKVDWVIDTPKKRMTRRMVDMVATINKTNFGGAQMVTCFTCHHGKDTPLTTISLDTLYAAPSDLQPDIISQAQGLPSADSILDKYIAAAGGSQKLAQSYELDRFRHQRRLRRAGSGGGICFRFLPRRRTSARS